LKFRNHSVSAEDLDHIRLHVEGLRRTLYNCQGEGEVEADLLCRAIAEAEAVSSTVEELLKGVSA